MLEKRSFSLARHRTSVALEKEFWAVLTELAAARGERLSHLVAAVDAARSPGQALASALRLFSLRRAAINACASTGGHDPPQQ